MNKYKKIGKHKFLFA